MADALDQSLDQVIDDDALHQIITACHPALAVERTDRNRWLQISPDSKHLLCDKSQIRLDEIVLK